MTDFGVARLREEHRTLTGQSLLTYEYASPEQFDNPRQVQSATDYYSLGVVLYEALTGVVPFPLDSTNGMMSFMHRLMHEQPRLTPLAAEGCPQALCNAIEALLQKSVEQRLSNPVQLMRHLKVADFELLQDEEAAARLHYLEITPLRGRQTTDQKDRSPTTKAEEPVVMPHPTLANGLVSEPSSAKARSRYPLWLVALAGIGVIAVGIYWSSTSSAIGNTVSPPVSAGAYQQEASVIQQQQEEALRKQRQKQRRKQLIALARQVTVTIPEHQANKLFGGISGVQVQLNNPTELAFKWVKAEVRYYLANGELYKTEDVYFHNVEPYSMPIQGAPDSPRGTSIDVTITSADSAELNELGIISQ